MASHAAAPIAPLPSPPARMKPGHWVFLIIGVLLSTLGLGLIIGGAVTLRADGAQQGGLYLMGDTERYRSTGYALTSPSVVLDGGSEAMPAIPQLGHLASVHVRVANVVPHQEVFVGIAEVSDIETYLHDVARSSLRDNTWSSADLWQGRSSWFKDHERTTSGDRVPGAPGEQDFWTPRPRAPVPRKFRGTWSPDDGPWWS